MTIADAPDTKAHDNVLDFTLAHFSPTTEEELYEAVRSATAADLEKFRDAYAAFAATGTTHAPVLKEGELRPYFPSGDMPDWLQGRFSIDNHALTEDGATGGPWMPSSTASSTATLSLSTTLCPPSSAWPRPSCAFRNPGTTAC